MASLEARKEPAALVRPVSLPKSSPRADFICAQVQTSAVRIVPRTVKPSPSAELTQTRLENAVPLMYDLYTLCATRC